MTKLKKTVPVNSKPCKWCQTPYPLTRKDREYCTNKCATYGWREEQRNKKRSKTSGLPIDDVTTKRSRKEEQT